MKLLSTVAEATTKILITILGFIGLYIIFSFIHPSRVSSIQHLNNLPMLGDITKDKEPIYAPLVMLTEPSGQGFCSGTVIDNNYIVTAAHCIVDERGLLRKGLIDVRDMTGKFVRVNARAAGANTRVDVGLIIGDFKDFRLAAIDYNDIISPESLHLMTLASCGFPEVQAPARCVEVTNANYTAFQIEGDGILFPGMSGGPVIAMTEAGPVIIAVNTAVEDTRERVVLSPIVGLQGMFDLYPKAE